MKTNNMMLTDDPDATEMEAIEAQMDRYQSATTWQADLAAQDLDGAGAHEIAARKLDAIVAELHRCQVRTWWLQDRLAEVQYSAGAQDYYDRAVRRQLAIEAVIDRVEARHAVLTTLRAAMEAEVAGCCGPGADANYDPADDCGPGAGIETTTCQA